MKRLLNILFWSVIAAAFIGPGTVTTAARAGSDFRFALAWALLFSVFACLVLQEASGRITVLDRQGARRGDPKPFLELGVGPISPGTGGGRHHPRMRRLRGGQSSRRSGRVAADRRCLARDAHRHCRWWRRPCCWRPATRSGSPASPARWSRSWEWPSWSPPFAWGPISASC